MESDVLKNKIGPGREDMHNNPKEMVNITGTYFIERMTSPDRPGARLTPPSFQGSSILFQRRHTTLPLVRARQGKAVFYPGGVVVI